jgi:N-glycosylase/DNA lyase
MAKEISELQKCYKNKKFEIKNRLEEFGKIKNENDERIFSELAFCICTPQSKATSAWKAIEALVKNNYLFTRNERMIRPFLNCVRFADNKTKYIVEARELFSKNGKLNIKEKIQSFPDNSKLREWLAENVKGLGMKESSHFLRNIGLGDGLAILDVHVLDNLKEYGVIEEIPKALTKKCYLEIEKKMKEFSKLVGISMDELDLLFWSEETGIIFK